jgi:hypothetical protein
MPGGKDAHTFHGRPNPVRVDDYGRNGSPTYPSAKGSVGGMTTRPGVGEGASRSVGMRPDEIHRAGIRTSASVRSDSYGGRHGSTETGGPWKESPGQGGGGRGEREANFDGNIKARSS